MHLAFVSHFDARDVRSWSGIPYFVARALRDEVTHVSIVTPLSVRRPPSVLHRALRARLRGRPFLSGHTRPVMAAYAAAARNALDGLEPDAVLAPSALPLALLDVPCPTAVWSDATFETNLGLYDEYTGLPDDLVAEGHALEYEAFSRLAHAFFAGHHASHSATAYYGADPARVHTVPFGANLDVEPDGEAVHEAVARRTFEECHLLFLGKDWYRKGGDVAVKAAACLHARGVPVTLHVVGPTPPVSRSLPFLRLHGFIDKRTPEGRQRFEALLAQSHFLILPSRAENFGCVYCEASAYGIPSLAADVGGVATAVRDGVNGRLLPARPSPAALADAVQALFEAPEAYRTLALSSRVEFEERLNWRVATARVVETLRSP